MDFNIYLTFLCLWTTITEAFFFLSEKNEPIWFCLKVCPLYCGHRRHDLDSPIYWDDDYGTIIHEEPETFIPYHYFCKPPKRKTTTPQPTTMATTTEEPTWICMVCMKKCGKLKSK